MSGPGKIAGRRVHTGRVIALDIDTVRFPDGSTGEQEIVRHPGASAVLPVLGDPDAADPAILLLKQYRYATGGYLYEIPAGRLEVGEDPAACAARELREETGCTAARIEPLFTVFTAPGFTDEKIHVFLASGLTCGAPAWERDEFIEVEEYPLTLALAMGDRGEICDAKTLLALVSLSRRSSSRRA